MKMKNDMGFTLIELVISMVLLCIILTPAYALLKSGLYSWAHGTEHIDVVQNMRFAMDRMTTEIRQAVDEPLIIANADGVIQIKFLVPILNKDEEFTGTVEISYQYDATDQELERKEGESSPPQPVASKIKSVDFSYDKPSLKIILVGIRRDGQEISMTSDIVLRSVSR